VTDVPIWILGVLLIVGLPAAAVGTQLGIRRTWPHLVEGEQNDVAGFVIAVVGVIYAVLLAFVVIVTWENFSDAEDVVGQEASALRTIYRQSAAFPNDVRDRLHDDVRRYAEAAIQQEWPAMARGQSGDPSVARILDEMSEHLTQLTVTTPVQQQYVGAEAARFNDLVGARSRRLDYVGGGVPTVLWIALIVGAVVTIGFATIFGLRSIGLHVVITASLAAVIGVLLFVALAIDHPFAGDVSVAPHPLERVLNDFAGSA
jgi:Protein of unknown function (DUF4239)